MLKVPKTKHSLDPVTYYNKKCKFHIQNLLTSDDWVSDDGYYFKKGNEKLILEDDKIISDAEPFMGGYDYSFFEALCLLNFDNDWRGAINWVQCSLMEDNPYIRVGVKYFKIIYKKDRYGVKRKELKVWSKDELKTDFGVSFIKKIPQFDDFILEPDNFEYKPFIGNYYNLYKEFAHKPKKGKIDWSMQLIEHIFGEQKDIGIKYLQALYQHPKRMLPILVLASEERRTGKTTFINWINMIFGDNVVIIDPKEITNSFNDVYATANIIAIEETFIEKKMAVEKIKALSTGKFITVNQKFVSQYKVPFYGHLIMSTNEVDRFIKIDQEEVRFFIREIKLPKERNTNIEDELLKEIPAFLDYLNSLPELDFSKDRALFTPDEIYNDSLKRVKEESKSWVYYEIKERINDFFAKHNSIDSFYATPIDIKDRFFASNNQITTKYISKVLTNEMKLTPENMMRFSAFDTIESRPGKPYFFQKNDETLKKTENDIPF